MKSKFFKPVLALLLAGTFFVSNATFSQEAYVDSKGGVNVDPTIDGDVLKGLAVSDIQFDGTAVYSSKWWVLITRNFVLAGTTRY